MLLLCHGHQFIVAQFDIAEADKNKPLKYYTVDFMK